MAQTQIHVPPGFDDLPKIDQVRYLQELWDRIADCPVRSRPPIAPLI
jgi:hypothetical protein